MDYKQALIICNVVEVEETPATYKVVTEATETTPAELAIDTPAVMTPKLDVPFEIYGCTIAYNNKVFYELSQELVGKQVLALITYMVDHPQIHRDDTYAVASLGENIIAMPWEDIPVIDGSIVTDFQNDHRVLQFWSTKKKDIVVGYTENETPIMYNEADKEKLSAFYPNDLMK
jgi:hypothetical protein